MATNLLPTLYINRVALLPKEIKEIPVKRSQSVLTVNLCKEKYNNQVIITPAEDNLSDKDGRVIGTLANIIKVIETANGLTVFVEGVKRVEILKEKVDKSDIVLSEFDPIKDKIGRKNQVEEIRGALTSGISELSDLPFEIDSTEINDLKKLSDSDFADRFASLLPLTFKEVLPLLHIETVEERLIYIIQKFGKISEDYMMSPEMKDAKKNVQQRVNNKIQGQQKEFYLREQIKAAQAELDELTGQGSEFDELRKRVESNPYPEHIKKKALAEIRKLEQTPAQAQEANITRQYIETLLDLPYWTKDEEQIDIAKAIKTLDKDHFGLEKPKSKIIEFLAVKQQNPDAKGSILALVGPPGTGKTTMAKSIADSLGRKLVKIALGGVKDESEIRGHRRTYIASQPGKIIQAMKKAGVINPIILLDEIDKMSADYKGDPTSAMLEVLDYEQNSMFQDHYVEEEYDLSQVTFIATANYYNDIPDALIDRLDIVEVSSYTELEKIQIFKKHILKRVFEETKIPKALFKWNDAAIKEMIRHYTIEAGVRQLHRETNTVARKLLVKKLNGELKATALTITPELLQELLGPQKFDYTKIDQKPQVGAVMGLAWTSYGGDILPIEITLYPGKGEVQLTGQLKDVMRESASIALSYIKSHAEELGVTKERLQELEELNIHVHSPDGATPKDGPSAGVTFTTALISAITGREVSQFIGMTGEISLRGNVLPIGGLKEKSISAYRSGLKTIFIPKENIKDLTDIPAEVKKNLEIVPVEHYTEIYGRLFSAPVKKTTAKTTAAKTTTKASEKTSTKTTTKK